MSLLFIYGLGAIFGWATTYSYFKGKERKDKHRGKKKKNTDPGFKSWIDL